MARDLDPKCKVCRRYGVKLFLKGTRCGTQKCAMTRRPYAPGPQGSSKKRGHSKSEYGRQFKEKQMLRYTYGLLEKQFRLYFEKAVKRKGQVGDNLMQYLESRLDNVVFRLGFTKSRNAARQMVLHGFIAVNGKKSSVPSKQVRAGEQITVRENKQKKKNIDLVSKTLDVKAVPAWLDLDPKTMTGKVMSLPDAKGVADVTVDLKSIIELYSK